MSHVVKSDMAQNRDGGGAQESVLTEFAPESHEPKEDRMRRRASYMKEPKSSFSERNKQRKISRLLFVQERSKLSEDWPEFHAQGETEM